MDHLPVMKQYNLVLVSQQVVEEVWFTIHNAGRKPTAGKQRWALHLGIIESVYAALLTSGLLYFLPRVVHRVSLG